MTGKYRKFANHVFFGTFPEPDAKKSEMQRDRLIDRQNHTEKEEKGEMERKHPGNKKKRERPCHNGAEQAN